MKDVSKLEMGEKLNYYNEANKMVAILCNHKKTVASTFSKTVEKLENRVRINLFFNLFKCVFK